MAISNLLSGRVRLKGPKNVTSDRYEFVDLSQVEPNFGVPSFSASLESNPAILVTDSDGNRGFAQKIVLNEITSSFKGIADLSGSFSGSFLGNFVGDGSGLVNVPSVIAPFIASGSQTASFDGTSLVVNTNAVIQGNTSIEGNLYVSQSIYAESLIVSYISSSIIYSSGSNIFGDTDSDKQELTGSVGIRDILTVNSATGSFSGSFIGSAIATGSFTGSFSGSFFGDGSGLTNIPALTATLIASGSTTASIAPNTGLVVNTFANFEYSVSASMFTGSGAGLFDIPRSALTPDALTSNRIASGSATASIQDSTGLLVNVPAFFEYSVSASMFSGSGRGLFDIPISNLSGDASRIASGSVTASVSPDKGFVVQSLESGSQFTGSLFVSGGIELSSGSSYSGSGARLFDIPRSALTQDALISTEIKSGSVTASVSPDTGFLVTSIVSGSTFSGSVAVVGNVTIPTGSGFFSGSGAGLSDIPRSALTADALLTTEIKSGSVTASVSPDRGFVVESVESGSRFLGNVAVSGSVSASFFIGDGSQLFNIPALTATLISSGSVTASVSPDLGFVVTSVEFGSTFSGSLFVSGGNIQVETGSFFSGSGAGLKDIPRSALTQDALISTEIKSGSVTASVSPDSGFVVTSVASGSTFSGSLFVSGGVQITTGSFFSGSGKGLFEIPQSALAFEINKIASGSATASIAPDTGFVVNVPANFEYSVSASMFTGSGAGLFDLPLSALSQEVFRIASGSVTASALPDRGFVVESVENGTKISGSVDVSGSVTINSGSYFVGDGRYLSNITLANLAIDSTKIFSGSATASISPDYGFNVNVDAFFTNNVSASAFTGSGEGLFNIPLSALAREGYRIATGSVTASVDPIDGFVVNSISTISGSLIVSSSGWELSTSSSNTTFDVINDGNSAYWFSGAASGSNPTLVLYEGVPYTFNVVAVGHPFYIKTSQTSGTGDTYDIGVVNQGVTNGILTFTPPTGSPDILYYVCQFHSAMSGQIIVKEKYQIDPTIKFVGDTIVSGNLYVPSSSYFVGDGRYLSNITLANLAIDSTKIFSGSATASIAPNTGLVVNTFANFEYSVSASMFTGSGKGLFDIPQSALASEVFRIVSGSVTASVAPDTGLLVTSIASGSKFSGSISVSGSITIPIGGGFFSGSGVGLSDIPRSALTEDALLSNLIASGSATASISPNKGLVVNTFTTISGSFVVSSSARPTPLDELPNTFDIINDTNTAYWFSGAASGSNPNLTLVKGKSYIFNIDAIGYPFWINTASVSGNDNGYDSGITNNGMSTGTPLTFNVPFDAPDTLYYNSENEAAMAGTINVVDAIYIPSEIKLVGDTRVVGVVTASVFSGSGAGLFDIPRSALTPDALVATLIASGSVTASVDPSYGFKVISNDYSGSEVSGYGIILSGSTVVSGSIAAFTFIGDGSQLQNVVAAASPKIASGSVTASVAPDTGFLVTSIVSGSTFSGSVVVSGSVRAITYFGDGSQLTGVIAERSGDTPRIASGSATASISPIDGLTTNVPLTIQRNANFSSSLVVSGSTLISGSISASLYRGDGSG